MKILCVITGMTTGGAERVMSVLCNQFAENNDSKVRLAIMKDKKSDYYISNKVECTSGNVKNKNLVKSVYFIKEQIEDFKPDIILSFMTKSNIVAIIARNLSKVKAPVVIAERANPYDEKKIYKIIRNLLYPKADAGIFQTDMQQDYYKNILKCDSKVLLNPLSPDFKAVPYKGERTKRIVCVARLYPEKNQKLLIYAFCRIAEKYSDYKLEFYGEGPERKNLQELIDKLKLNDRVFLMGRQKKIIEHIQDASIFVLPSDSEGMPNSLLEAMTLRNTLYCY